MLIWKKGRFDDETAEFKRITKNLSVIMQLILERA